MDEVHSVHRLKGNGVVDASTGDLTGGGGGSGTSSWKGDIGTVKVLNYYPLHPTSRSFWQGPVGAGAPSGLVNNYGVRALCIG
jgi:hypothetical protein